MNSTHSRPYTFDRVVRIIIGLTIIVIFVLLIDKLSAVLLPFVIGWVLAYLFHPVIDFFQKKLRIRNRLLAIALALLLLLVVIGGIVLILIPLISKEITKFSELVALYTQNFTVDNFLPTALQSKIREFFRQLDIQSLLSDQNIQNLVRDIAPKLWGIVNSSISVIIGVVAFFVVILYFIFILLDYDKINIGFIKMIPVKYRSVFTGVLSDLKNGMNRYFRGQALIASINGILFAIGFSIVGLPLGIVLGLLMGVLNLIPYLQMLGYIPAMLLALLKMAETGQSYWLILLQITIVIVIVQIIEQVLLTPKIMKKATGLNPAIILLSLSVWGALLGLIGMIIALPVTTLMISYYKRYILHENQMSIPPETETLEEEKPTGNNDEFSSINTEV